MALRNTRVLGKVEAHAKTTGSVIGKTYRKPDDYSSLDAFRDLAGARVLVPFADDVEPLAHEIHAHPDITVFLDEVKVRKPDHLTYQARHLDIVLSPDVAPRSPTILANVSFGARYRSKPSLQRL